MATFYTMYKRRPDRRLAGQRLHQHHVRRAGRPGGLRRARRAAGGRPRRDHRRTAGSPWSTRSAWPPATTRPVMTVNYEFFDQTSTRTGASSWSTELRGGERPQPTRGARLCTLKEMSLQLAGFPTSGRRRSPTGPRRTEPGRGPAGGRARHRGARLRPGDADRPAGADPGGAGAQAPATARSPRPTASPRVSRRRRPAVEPSRPVRRRRRRNEKR